MVGRAQERNPTENALLFLSSGAISSPLQFTQPMFCNTPSSSLCAARLSKLF